MGMLTRIGRYNKVTLSCAMFDHGASIQLQIAGLDKVMFRKEIKACIRTIVSLALIKAKVNAPFLQLEGVVTVEEALWR